MTRGLISCLLALILALAGTGCLRSPRINFYTLLPTPRPAGTAAGAAAAAAGTTAAAASPGATSAGTAAAAPVAGAIVVGPVTLPELVDRPQLVVRVAPNRVDILEGQRWAEPLRDEIPRVIAEDLSRLLGSSLVSTNLQHAGPEPEYRVLLDVVRFEASAGEAVNVEVLWSLRRASWGTSLHGRSLVAEPAPGDGYDALVAAYGRALNAVSIDLARAISVGAAGEH